MITFGNAKTLRADLILLFASVIWGSAFVAQRVGMDHVGPFTYNGVRFILGSLVLLPFLKKHIKHHSRETTRQWKSVSVVGFLLFCGASLQQWGLQNTTAGKAGFLTSLYVILVPTIGFFWKNPPPLLTWVGALFAVIGTYFLSVTEKLTFNAGDVFILLSAIPWSFHVLTIEKAIQKVDSLFLSFCQFFICGVLCLIVAAFTEPLTFSGIYQSWIPIAYGGILSVGLGYTLQVVAQKDAPASHVVILLSLESVFAALSEWIWLGEKLSNRSLLGCTLMFSGVLLAQVRISKSHSNTAPLNER